MTEHDTRTFCVVDSVDGWRVGRKSVEATLLSAPIDRCLEEGAHVGNVGEKLLEGCHMS